MQSIYVPKYDIHYRINPKNPCELQWSKKPFGPMTAWQKAFTFTKPIRALDIDDNTQQGVVVLNDSSTYVGSGVRVWGRKYYTAGSRLYSLYAIGESKMKKMKITVHESKMSAGMARSILNGSIEGDKEDARRNLNRLYSEWVVKFKTKDGKPYTMKISGAEDEADAWKQAVASAERNGNGDKIDKTAPLSIDYIQKWESVKKTSLKIRVHEGALFDTWGDVADLLDRMNVEAHVYGYHTNMTCDGDPDNKDTLKVKIVIPAPCRYYGADTDIFEIKKLPDGSYSLPNGNPYFDDDKPIALKDFAALEDQLRKYQAYAMSDEDSNAHENDDPFMDA